MRKVTMLSMLIPESRTGILVQNGQKERIEAKYISFDEYEETLRKASESTADASVPIVSGVFYADSGEGRRVLVLPDTAAM